MWDCEIGEYLKESECMKSLIDDGLGTCDEIEDTPRSTLMNCSDGINY